LPSLKVLARELLGSQSINKSSHETEIPIIRFLDC
jgi:hypothetical protein